MSTLRFSVLWLVLAVAGFGLQATVTSAVAAPLPSNIGDRVFRPDASGTQTGAANLSGVTVQLLDSASNVLQTTTSNATGFYAFTAPAGTYQLKFIAPVGMVPTPNRDAGGSDTNDSDIDANGLTPFFTITGAQVRTDLDAGFVFLINVGNFVWEDLNQNGVQDSGEPGIVGAAVQLWNADKTQMLDATTTNASGLYTLKAPGPGSYRVRVIPPFPGDRFTLKDQGTDTTDNDVNPSGVDAGFTDIYTFAPNLISTTTIDAGVISDPFRDHNIGDFVFRANASGGQAGQSGITNVEVQLLDANGAVVQTTTSGANGFYSFKASPGTYRLKFVAPGGMVPSPHPDAGGNDTVDSDIDENGLTALFTISTGEVRRDLDAGFVFIINVGNFVWNDLNTNGALDAGEPGLEDVLVELWDSAKTRRFDSTSTNASGLYTLHAPGPGDYRVFVLPPAPTDKFSPKDAAANDQTDSDINGNGTDFGFTDVYTFAPNLLSTTTIDAGLQLATGPRDLTPLQMTGIDRSSSTTWILTFTGPIGSTALIETSDDFKAWVEAVPPFVMSSSPSMKSVKAKSGATVQFWRVRRAR